MAPSYKLTYYPARAIAEPIRFLLHYGDIDFEDYRFEMDTWAKLKPTMPFRQVPTLEVDGKTAYQSIAICRYLAKQVKLTGENEWEDLEIDAIVDTVSDFRAQIIIYFWEADAEKQATLKEILYKKTLPYYLERFETIAKANNGHLALGKLTWADMYFIGLIDYLNFAAGTNLIADYPNLQEIQKNVLSVRSLKEWVEKRPKSDL